MDEWEHKRDDDAGSVASEEAKGRRQPGHRNNPSCSGLSRASRATGSSLALDPRLKAEGDERSNWKRAWQLAVSHAAHAEVLHLEEFLDAVLGAFAADAGFLHAAEGRDLGGDAAGVDADQAGPPRLADAPTSEGRRVGKEMVRTCRL